MARIALAVWAAALSAVLYRAGILGPELFQATARDVAVTPEGVEFRNHRGNNTVVLWNDKWGAPHVYILDKDKNVRMTLNVSQQGAPSLELFDGNGLRGSFEAGSDGTTSVNLFGAGKKGGVSMHVRQDGTPTLTLTDKDGKILFQSPHPSPGPADESHR